MLHAFIVGGRGGRSEPTNKKIEVKEYKNTKHNNKKSSNYNSNRL